MAKGQMRSNKEAKKPKGAKKPTDQAAGSGFTKGARAPIAMPKKKK